MSSKQCAVTGQGWKVGKDSANSGQLVADSGAWPGGGMPRALPASGSVTVTLGGVRLMFHRPGESKYHDEGHAGRREWLWNWTPVVLLLQRPRFGGQRSKECQ